MDLLGGLEVNNGGRERAPALLWTRSSEEEEAGNHWKGREKVYIYTPSPQRSLKSQIAIGEERERYIYP